MRRITGSSQTSACIEESDIESFLDGAISSAVDSQHATVTSAFFAYLAIFTTWGVDSAKVAYYFFNGNDRASHQTAFSSSIQGILKTINPRNLALGLENREASVFFSTLMHLDYIYSGSPAGLEFD